MCGICHYPIEPGDLMIDHIIALADGGSDTIDNKQPTHAACNLRKGRGP